MAVTTDDHALRFIQIHLGDVGVSHDQLSIDGFEEAMVDGENRLFLKSWSEFDRGDNRELAKTREN